MQENNWNICYKVTEDDTKNRLNYNTKEFFNIVKLEKGFISSSKKLAELVQDGKTAIFPVYAKCRIIEIKSYLEMGFTCYLLEYKQYKEFEKYYKSL